MECGLLYTIDVEKVKLMQRNSLKVIMNLDGKTGADSKDQVSMWYWLQTPKSWFWLPCDELSGSQMTVYDMKEL